MKEDSVQKSMLLWSFQIFYCLSIWEFNGLNIIPHEDNVQFCGRMHRHYRLIWAYENSYETSERDHGKRYVIGLLEMIK